MLMENMQKDMYNMADKLQSQAVTTREYMAEVHNRLESQVLDFNDALSSNKQWLSELNKDMSSMKEEFQIELATTAKQLAAKVLMLEEKISQSDNIIGQMQSNMRTLTEGVEMVQSSANANRDLWLLAVLVTCMLAVMLTIVGWNHLINPRWRKQFMKDIQNLRDVIANIDLTQGTAGMPTVQDNVRVGDLLGNERQLLQDGVDEIGNHDDRSHDDRNYDHMNHDDSGPLTSLNITTTPLEEVKATNDSATGYEVTTLFDSRTNQLCHTGPCDITAVTMVNKDLMVLCDYNHKSLLLVSIEGVLYQDLPVTFSPADCCMYSLSGHHVDLLVSAHGQCSLEVLSLTKKPDLQLSNTITIHTDYEMYGIYGVCSFKNTIAITCKEEIKLLTRDGMEISSISDKRFKELWYITMHQPLESDCSIVILASDWGAGKIHLVRDTGQYVKSFNVRHPAGVTCHGKELYYVNRDTQKVIGLDVLTNQTLREIPCRLPIALVYRDHSGWLLIAHHLDEAGDVAAVSSAPT